MTTLYIHIGDAKTGTSYLQKYCAQHEEALLAQGILYPKSARLSPNGVAHHHVPFSINRYPEWISAQHHLALADVVRSISIEAEENPETRVLISSEGFCSFRSLNTVESIARAFDDYNVRIIVYIRRPDAWYASFYAQNIKAYPYSVAHFREFMARHRNSVYGVVSLYSRVFGPSNVYARSYENAIHSLQGIVGDLSRLLDIELPSPPSAETENVSPKSQDIALLRLLNAELKMEHRERKALYQKVLDLARQDSQDAALSEEEAQALNEAEHQRAIDTDAAFFGSRFDLFRRDK